MPRSWFSIKHDGSEDYPTMKTIAAALFRDFIGLVGCAAVSYGAWLIYNPLGFIVGGAFMVVAATFLSRVKKADNQ